MTRATRVAAATFPLLLVLLICGFKAETAGTADVSVVVTSAVAYEPLAALQGAERFPQGAHLMMVRVRNRYSFRFAASPLSDS